MLLRQVVHNPDLEQDHLVIDCLQFNFAIELIDCALFSPNFLRNRDFWLVFLHCCNNLEIVKRKKGRSKIRFQNRFGSKILLKSNGSSTFVHVPRLINADSIN